MAEKSDSDSSLDNIFEEFLVTAEVSDLTLREKRTPITIWVPLDYKAKFDEAQKKSRCRFGKKMREIFMTCIDRFEQKAS